MVRLLFILVLVFAVWAPSAGAVTGYKPERALTHSTEIEKLGEYLPAARAHNPGSSCEGREDIRLRAAATIELQHPVGTAGMWTGGCTVWITQGLNAYQFCITLAHELAHAAGHSHLDGTPLMADPPPARFGPCDRATLRYRFGDAWHNSLRQVPDGGRGWTSRRARSPATAVLSRRGRCDRVVMVSEQAGLMVGSVSVGSCRRASGR